MKEKQKHHTEMTDEEFYTFAEKKILEVVFGGTKEEEDSADQPNGDDGGQTVKRNPPRKVDEETADRIRAASAKRRKRTDNV